MVTIPVWMLYGVYLAWVSSGAITVVAFCLAWYYEESEDE